MTNISNRTFGVEIECKTDLSMRALCEVLQDNGISAYVPDWEGGEGWKIVEDGSVDDGWEVVSPILSGVEGIAEVARVLNILRDLAGCWIDESCGLHVHVNANDLSSASIANAVLRYERHSAKIDAIVPPRRRENRFCLDVTHEAQMIRRRLGKISSIAPYYLAALADSRYRKLNIAAFCKHGTLEFRLHDGTLKVADVTNWIAFCVQFVEDSICTVTDDMGLDTLVVKEDLGPFANLSDETRAHFNNRANSMV